MFIKQVTMTTKLISRGIIESIHCMKNILQETTKRKKVFYETKDLSKALNSIYKFFIRI